MATVENATEVRPFQLDIPKDALEDLRRRIEATRLPSKELVEDRSQGVQLATIHELATYWATEYDWRKAEARLNALPQFTTEIDGVNIHFIHVRSPHENALPLIMTHGWPGSVVEMIDSVGPLTDPTAHGGQRRGCVPSGAALPARVWLLGRAGRGRLGSGPDRTSLGRAYATASATPATWPRAATWAPASPTRWAARHPRG